MPFVPVKTSGASETSVSFSETWMLALLVPSVTWTVSAWVFGVCSKSLASEAAPAAVSVMAPVDELIAYQPFGSPPVIE